MTRRLRIPLAVLAIVACAAPLPAIAQQKGAGAPSTLPPDSASNEPKTKEQLEAQQHFQRAKDLYQTGAYREAIAELELARTLDPKGKDLVFNLGIVHEKLGKFDEAITYFRQYMEMDTVSSAERAKAENIIKRIEGAKREVPVVPTATASTTVDRPPPPPEDHRRGRFDAATIVAGSVAIAGIGVGTAFGIVAVSNKPSSTFITGRDGTYDKLQSQSNDAHTQAIIADVGFGVGIAAAVVAAVLYFGRTKTPHQTAIVPSATPLASGGAFLLGGTFR